MKRLIPIFLLLLCATFASAGVWVHQDDARNMRPHGGSPGPAWRSERDADLSAVISRNPSTGEITFLVPRERWLWQGDAVVDMGQAAYDAQQAPARRAGLIRRAADAHTQVVSLQATRARLVAQGKAAPVIARVDALIAQAEAARDDAEGRLP